MAIVQGGLALYVCRVGRARSELPALLGARWTSRRRACVDLVLASVGWASIRAIELAWSRLAGSGAAPAVQAILPQSAPECLAWVALSIVVGFCEEVVFRGYLLAQFEAFSGSASVAVALQAAIFGLAHAEQGAGALARATLYGLGFGVLARWRRSLVPGVACHVATDLASGLLPLLRA